jgi:hypothetical protein
VLIRYTYEGALKEQWEGLKLNYQEKLFAHDQVIKSANAATTFTKKKTVSTRAALHHESAKDFNFIYKTSQLFKF